MNQSLIDRYVAGRLSEPEAEEFEAYCVANPEFARQVEYEQLLRAGFAQTARAPTQLVRTNKSWYWTLALAASLVLAIGLVLHTWRPWAGAAAPSVMAAVGAELPNGLAAMRLAMVRGAEASPLLPRGRVRIEIVGLFDLAADYSVALERIDESRGAQTVAKLNEQRASSPMMLQVLLDSDRLEPGAYSLRVRKQDSSDEPLDFMFVKP